MKKHCRRKHYLLVNPIKHAIDGAVVMQDEDLAELRVIELKAVEAFRNDLATIQEWHEINSLMNVSEMMASQGVGPEVLSTCGRVQEVLKEAQERFKRTGDMKVASNDVFWFRELYEYHDLQRKSVARSAYERYIRDTVNAIKGKGKRVEVL